MPNLAVLRRDEFLAERQGHFVFPYNKPLKGAFMNIYDNNVELPLGFGIALAKNSEAMRYFVGLSPAQRAKIVEQTHRVGSKKEMEAFVNGLEESRFV